MSHPISRVLSPLLLVLLVPAAAWAGWTLFDDASASIINAGLWSGDLTDGGSSSPTTEARRYASNGRFHVGLTQWGRVDSDSGVSTGTNRLRIANPPALTGMQAKIAVEGAIAEGCPANGSTAMARARMLANLFNDGSSPGAGDLTGDIVAAIETILDGVAGQVIRAIMFRCANASCSVGNDVVEVTFGTRWTFNHEHTIRFEWDPSNKQVLYFVKPRRGAVEMQVIPYTYTDSDGVGGRLAHFQSRNNPVNCTGGRKRAQMDFSIDNVMLLLP